MEHYWKWDGGEYPFDISDADCLERIGKIFASVRKELSDEDALTPAERSAKTCNTVRDMFTALFGADESLAICGKPQSAARCSEAYLDFIAFLNEQVDEFSRIREAVEARYSARAAALASAGSGFRR